MKRVVLKYCIYVCLVVGICIMFMGFSLPSGLLTTKLRLYNVTYQKEEFWQRYV